MKMHIQKYNFFFFIRSGQGCGSALFFADPDPTVLLNADSAAFLCEPDPASKMCKKIPYEEFSRAGPNRPKFH